MKGVAHACGHGLECFAVGSELGHAQDRGDAIWGEGQIAVGRGPRRLAEHPQPKVSLLLQKVTEASATQGKSHQHKHTVHFSRERERE